MMGMYPWLGILSPATYMGLPNEYFWSTVDPIFLIY